MQPALPSPDKLSSIWEVLKEISPFSRSRLPIEELNRCAVETKVGAKRRLFK